MFPYYVIDKPYRPGIPKPTARLSGLNELSIVADNKLFDNFGIK